MEQQLTLTCRFISSFAALFAPGQAQDRVRNQKLPAEGPVLDYFGASAPASTH